MAVATPPEAPSCPERHSPLPGQPAPVPLPHRVDGGLLPSRPLGGGGRALIRPGPLGVVAWELDTFGCHCLYS